MLCGNIYTKTFTYNHQALMDAIVAKAFEASFVKTQKKSLLHLCKARPFQKNIHLKYGIPVIRSIFIERIENVQRRFSKYLCVHQSVPYHAENYLALCKKYHQLFLTIRREMADCSLMIKILSNDVDSSELQEPVTMRRFVQNLRQPTTDKTCLFYVQQKQ